MREQSNNHITLNSNYQKLLCYKKSLIVYDLTYHFCSRFINPKDRTFDQMIQAARSGKQNIVEGYTDLATSKEMGIKLLNVARGSLAELHEDFCDYLRVRNLRIWERESDEAKAMARLGNSGKESRYFVELAESRSDETIANMTLILIKQAIILTFRYIERVSENFAKEGGFKERMTQIRLNERNKR